MFFFVVVIKLHMFITEKSGNQINKIKTELLKYHNPNSLQIFIFSNLARPPFKVTGQKWRNTLFATN